LTFEAAGGQQLSRFRADPANKGEVLNTGLWRYTRPMLEKGYGRPQARLRRLRPLDQRILPAAPEGYRLTMQPTV
jgi:hypothetical protein